MANPPQAPVGAEAPVARRRWRWIALGLLGLGIASRAALPPALVWFAEPRLSEALGRTVEVDDVDLALLGGALVLTGVRVGEALEAPSGAEAAPPLLTCARARATLSWPALIVGRLHLREVTLEDPVLRLARSEEGGFESIVLNAGSDPAPSEDVQDPPIVRLDRLVVQGAALRLARVAEPGEDALSLELAELFVTDVHLDGADLSVGDIALRGPRLRLRRDFVPPPTPADSATPGELEPEVELEPEDERDPEGEREEGRAGASGVVDLASAAPTETDLATGVARLAIEDARLVLLTEAEPLELVLDLTARDVTGAIGETFALELGLKVGEGRLALDGRVGVTPPGFEGTLEWTDLPLAPFVAAASAGEGIVVADGASHGTLHIVSRVGEAETPGVGITGEIGVRDLDLTAEEPEVSAAWSSLDIGIEQIAWPLPGTEGPEPLIALSSVRLSEADVRVRWTPPAAEQLPEPEPATTGATLPEIRIGEVQVESSEVRLTDASLQPAFEHYFKDLDLSARSVAWPRRDVLRYRLTGRGRENGRIAVSGSMRGGVGTVRSKVQNLELPAYSVYTAAGSGIRIVSGKASVESEVRVNGTRLDSDNAVVLHALDIDEEREGAFQQLFGMRLEVGLALLRDHKGDIAIPVPVTLESGQAGVRLTRILATALQRAIVSALTSPMRTLGAVVVARAGTEGGGLAPLDSPPGSPDLERGSRERLVGIALLLEERPELGLVLTGLVADLDDPILAERWLVERVQAGEELPKIDELGFLARRRVRAALRREGAVDFSGLERRDEVPLLAWAHAAVLPRERRAGLARARAEGARTQLVGEHGVLAERIVIGDGEKGAPGVAMELASAGGGDPREPLREVGRDALD